MRTRRFRFSCLIGLLSLSLFTVWASAARCEASSPESEYNKIQRELKAERERLEKAKRRESSILSDIEEINRQMKGIEDDLRKYRVRLRNTERQMAQVEAERAASKAAVERHRLWMKRKLRTMYKYGRTTDVMLLLVGAQDLPQLIRTAKNLEYLTAYEQRRLRTYQENLTILHAREKQLAQLKKDLVAQREKVLAEEAALSAKRKDKESVLTSVKKEKSSSVKMIREMEAAAKRLLDIMSASEARDRVSGSGFAALKGRLPWPVEGKVVVPYGSQRDPQFNTPVFRSGTFIESPADAVARAIHAGKVVFAEWFKGYGQLVIVNHGEGYHSLYGSLSEIFTKVGDIIRENQILGRVGNSGLIDLPGLYFELRYKGKPLNPLQWLRKR